MNINLEIAMNWFLIWLVLSLIIFGILKYKGVEASGWELFLLICLCIVPPFGLIYMMILLGRKKKLTSVNSN